MKTRFKYSIMVLTLALAGGAAVLYSCKNNAETGTGPGSETMTAGKITILTDESVQPVVEDVLQVFHSVYPNAHVNQVNSTENEIVNALMGDVIKTVVMTRPLTKDEENHFTNRGVKPEVTFFATDAVAFITAGKPADSTITQQEIFKVLRGEKSERIKNLVLDNPNSGTVQYLMQQAGVSKLPSVNITYRKNSPDLITFVNSNPGTIGVLGVSWLMEPTPQLEKVVENLTVLAVDNVKTKDADKSYYKPSQSNIGAGLYPFTRKLYVLNYQGYKGLGIGFGNYIRAEQGQRIILKAGLLPQEIPTREIEIRTELNNN